MHLHSASLIVLAATLSFAQKPAATNNPTNASSTSASDRIVFQSRHADNSSCPVGFDANRRSITRMMTASDRQQSESAQGLHVMLDHRDAPAIESVEVTVYGVSLKPRAIPAGQLVGETRNDTITKTFELRRQSGIESLTESDVWMPHVGAVNWVDLISINYADGTSWNAAGNTRCRAIPSNLLLVGQR